LFFPVIIIVTRSPLKSRKCTRKRLAARLRQDPLGERLIKLPVAAIWGPTSKGRGRGKGRGGREREGKGEGEGEDGKWRKGSPPTFLFKFTP